MAVMFGCNCLPYISFRLGRLNKGGLIYGIIGNDIRGYTKSRKCAFLPNNKRFHCAF